MADHGDTGDKKGWGKTVLGWFVENEGSGAAPSATSTTDADALIAKYAGGGVAAGAPVSKAALPGPLPEVQDGKIDYAKVLEQGGVDAEERQRVERARELLSSLPKETPAPVKRQIVEASLKAFGVPTDKIIEAAVAEMEALQAFLEQSQGETQTILSEGTARIADLERSIAEVKQVMQKAVSDQQLRTTHTNAEKLKIQEVLEFFGQDVVAKVVQDSPKLHQP